MTEHFESKDIMSPKELERRAEQDALRALREEFEPFEEEKLRIIEVQRRVSRPPQWNQVISFISELNAAIMKLEKQVVELGETVKGSSRIYNATIYELDNNKYEVSTPIQIVIEEDGEEAVARMPELNLYASADTDSEAIYELKKEIVKLYEDLEGTDMQLGPLPTSWLETLRKLIVRKDA